MTWRLTNHESLAHCLVLLHQLLYFSPFLFIYMLLSDLWLLSLLLHFRRLHLTSSQSSLSTEVLPNLFFFLAIGHSTLY